MRGATGIGLLALALVGVCACEQKKEDVGQTTTTAGETEQQRAAREQQNVPGAVPVTPPQEQPTAKTDESAAQKAIEAGKQKAQGEKPKAEAPRKKVIVKKTVITKKVVRPKAKEEPTSETATTGAEMKKVPPREQPQQPLEPGQQANPPGGEPLPTEQPQVQGVPYVNHSTVLGDGKSGMYTGGQGTYGGRATWGTGGGIPAYPPAPR